jgi:BolA protein
MGEVADRIRDKLTAVFSPETLEVVDQSERHRGHGGWREGGETHFDVRITAAAFEGLSRVQRQRAVNAALAEELAGPVHALSISAEAPT